jgi:hypothetical protein
MPLGARFEWNSLRVWMAQDRPHARPDKLQKVPQPISLIPRNALCDIREQFSIVVNSKNCLKPISQAWFRVQLCAQLQLSFLAPVEGNVAPGFVIKLIHADPYQTARVVLRGPTCAEAHAD